MTRVNWIFWAEVGVVGVVALAVVVAAAELHGRWRVLKEASAIAVTAALRSFAATIEPAPDGLERIRARTQERAA